MVRARHAIGGAVVFYSMVEIKGCEYDGCEITAHVDGPDHSVGYGGRATVEQVVWKNRKGQYVDLHDHVDDNQLESLSDEAWDRAADPEL